MEKLRPTKSDERNPTPKQLIKVTNRAVEKLAPPERGYIIGWDKEVKGFGIRATAAGVRSFIVNYRLRGEERLKTPGRYGALVADEARNQAKAWLRDVAEGIDPAKERQAQKIRMTFAELAEQYIEQHAKPEKSPTAAKEDERKLRSVLIPAWGDRPAEEITRLDVTKLRIRMKKKISHITANRYVALLGKMFALAIEWGVRPDNPARSINPEPEDPRDRWLWPDEIRRMFESLTREHDPIIRGALSFILSTGARRSEALSARWTDIDFDAALWRIPMTKAKKVQTIPISGHAMGALQSLPRVDGYPWVFPGRAPGKPLVNLSKPWQRVRKRAGLEDIRIHDLRQSFGSMMVQAGASLYVAQRALRHSDSRTTADVYGVFGDDPLGAAFEAVGEKVAALMTNKYAGAMPKRSVDAFRPEGLAIGRCFYSETDIDSIIEVAGGLPDGGIEHTRANESGNPPFWTGLVSRREALVERLHWAVRSLDLNLQFQTKSTPQQLTDAFDKVENAAARLVKALCLPRKIKPEDMLGSMPPALSWWCRKVGGKLENWRKLLIVKHSERRCAAAERSLRHETSYGIDVAQSIFR